MFCFQCEQTAFGTGCTTQGMCGKDADTAGLQDLLIHVLKGLAFYAHRQAPDGDTDATVLDALFATLTNVNFDAEAIARRLDTLVALRSRLAAGWTGGETPSAAARFVIADDRDARMAAAESVGIAARQARLGADVVGLQEMLTYGLKGIAAYAHHAGCLGHRDPEVMAFVYRALDALGREEADLDTLWGLVLDAGGASVRTLALLDAANTQGLGHPVPTPVTFGHRPGKAILVSGHDLHDLKALLEQTAGRDIAIYTHGEMLPAHGYPELNKHPHLVGHIGGAWMKQRQEFATFPGAILMTSNCIQEPRKNYRDRLFTCGPVGWPGVTHITDGDFAPVIAAALAAPGFTDMVTERTHTVGFGHQAVLGVAETVVKAVQDGALRHIALIGGCDGFEPERQYFTDLGAGLPDDALILTLGCGKFRVLDHDHGTLGGLPRLIDMGQCNDAHSAVVVAQALAQAFGTDVNGLPLSLHLSWLEQKAVCVLLALLHLGVQGITIGPKLPAFVTPNLLQVLVDRFGVRLAKDARADLAALAVA